ncbi:MAG: hypothetical protein AB8B84_13590 [Granulosicoccus sp.]
MGIETDAFQGGGVHINTAGRVFDFPMDKSAVLVTAGNSQATSHGAVGKEYE